MTKKKVSFQKGEKIKNKKFYLVVIPLVCLALFILSFIVISALRNSNENQEDNLAQCLTKKGAVFYGAETCGYCNKQKEMFGEDFEFVTYVSCLKDRSACVDAGIRAYPTWIIGGKEYVGLQTLVKLKEISGC